MNRDSLPPRALSGQELVFPTIDPTMKDLAWEFLGLNDAKDCIKNPTVGKCALTAMSFLPVGKIKALKSLEKIDYIVEAKRSTAGRVDRSSFFSAVRDSLPLDPPLESSRSWDALSDSLWDGRHTMPASQVVVLWAGAGPPETGQEQDFQHALWILRDLVDTLADGQLTVGAPTKLTFRVAVGTQTQPLAQRLLHKQ
ncbi:barstar family protein [Streptomyces sp. NPDC059759]|uniref:barstar family protein n=1 Tax=Streptomyces sp. NPDC059759 TaxID=3346936 RepID=UPI00365A9865